MRGSRRAKGTPSLGPVLDFLRATWQFDHALQSVSKRMEARMGITAPQRLVIRILGRFSEMPAGRLASLLHLHPSTLTGILSRLHRRRLIVRQVDARDRRCICLRLTAKGKELDRTAEGTVEAAVRDVLDQLPPGKTRNTKEVLHRLAETLIEDSVSSRGCLRRRSGSGC